MANSIIEDALNDPINESGNGSGVKTSKPKKSKKIIVFFIIFLIIIIVGTVGIIFYLKNGTTEISSKAKFFEYLTSNNLESIMEVSSYEGLAEKLVNENNVSETSIDISYETEDEGISGIELILTSENDADNDKSYTNANITYSNNDLFEFEILTSSDSIALKSDEVVNAFVDIPFEYWLSGELWNYSSELTIVTDEDEIELEEDEDATGVTIITSETDEIYDTDEYYSDSIDLTEFVEKILPGVVDAISNMKLISDESLQVYTNILNENLDDTYFSSRVVTLSMDSETISATEYTLTITEEEFINIIIQCLQALMTDTDTIENFSELLSVLGFTEEEFVSILDNLAVSLDETETSGNNIEIAVYENEEKTVKVAVQYLEMKLEIEYEYGTNENSIKITAVNEDETGISCQITNAVSDLASQINMDLSVISYSEVYANIVISANLVGSNNSYTLDAGIFYQDISNNSVDIDIASEIEFTDDVEVDDLTDENSVSIEDLSDEQLDAIYEQLQNVLNEKLSELSYIDTNTTSTIIGQDSSDDDDETEKAEVKEALILAVQEEMTIALENDEEYTIQDLADLEMEGYTLSIEISDDIATIDLNGYIFYIDSGFNLSE